MRLSTFPEKYEILKCLGTGASGEVYLARDTRTGRAVALKRYLPEAELNEEFAAEAAALRRLRSRFVVRFLDSGSAEGRAFVAAEYIEGPTLEEVLPSKALPDSAALHLEGPFWLRLLGALDCLHSAGLVHRDIKPANVLLEDARVAAPQSLATFVPKLGDFGFAKSKARGGRSSRSGTGTLGYLAPEQLRDFHAADERSDLFSFGAIVYRYATGSLPYESLSDFSQGHPPVDPKARNPEIPPHLADLLLKLVSPHPLTRPGSALEGATLFAERLYPGGIVFSPAGPWEGPLSGESLTAFFLHSFTPPFPPHPSLAAHLLRESGGQAAVLQAYLRFLAQEGLLERSPWGEFVQAQSPQPRTLGSSFYTLLVPPDLEKRDRDLLQAAACLGESFTAAEAASVCGLSPSVVQVRLRYLHTANVVRREGAGWSFAVPLLARLLRETAPPKKKRRFHQKAAQCRQGRVPPEQLAFHLQEAGRFAEARDQLLASAQAASAAGNLSEAAQAARAAVALPSKLTDSQALRAARILVAAGAPGKALELYRRFPRSDLSHEVLQARALAELRSAQYAEAQASFSDIVKRLGGKERDPAFLSALQGLATCLRALGRIGEAQETAQRIAALSQPGTEDHIQAVHLLGMLAKDRGELSRSEQLLCQAVRETEQRRDRERTAVALTNLGNVLRAQGRCDEAIGCYLEALRYRRQAADERRVAITTTSLAQAHFARGDTQQALRAVSESYRCFLAAGDRKGMAVALVNRGSFLWYAGCAREALQALRRARSLAERIGHTPLLIQILFQLQQVVCRLGDPEGPALARRIAASPHAPAEVKIQAEAYGALGALYTCQPVSSPSVEAVRAKAGGLHNPEARCTTLVLASEAALLEGRTGEALPLAQEAYHTLPQTGSPFLRCTCARALGEAYVEEGPLWADQAERYLAEALASAQALGFAYERARALSAWALYLWYTGEERKAAQWAQKARAIFAELTSRWVPSGVKTLSEEDDRGNSTEDSVAPSSHSQ